MFWSVAASKAAAAINNKIASKCSISTVCQLSSLAGLMVELCLSFRNSKLISKQSSSSNMDCSILPANNKLCSPPPAPGNTGAPHVIYSPVPCFLPETSSEKNKLTQHQSRARLNPRVLQELPWGTTKLEHPQCPTHWWECERRVLTCDEGVHDDMSGFGLHHRHLVHTFCGRWRSYDRFHVGIPILILWETAGDSLRQERISAPGQDTSLTTQVKHGHAALAASLIPWEKSLLCAHCSPGMFRALEFIAMNKRLAPSIWKPTRLRTNKLLDQVQKGQRERIQNICSSYKCKLDSKVNWAKSTKSTFHRQLKHQLFTEWQSQSTAWGEQLVWFFLIVSSSHISTTDHKTPAKKQKISARKQNIE